MKWFWANWIFFLCFWTLWMQRHCQCVNIFTGTRQGPLKKSPTRVEMILSVPNQVSKGQVCKTQTKHNTRTSLTILISRYFFFISIFSFFFWFEHDFNFSERPSREFARMVNRGERSQMENDGRERCLFEASLFEWLFGVVLKLQVPRY